MCFGSIFAQQEKELIGTTILSDSLKTGTLPTVVSKDGLIQNKKAEFAPIPSRAVLYSAFFPGLGQIYNRKYWKLPLIYGGYAGITYALAWNNQYLKDYTAAYNDLQDNDPNTNSFYDILPASMKEAYKNGTLTQDRLSTILKNQKDFFRRNRDLSIISMGLLYFVTMIDAYVDAQLFQFDISPELSMKVQPSMIRINEFNNRSQGLGLQCSINF